MALRRVAVEGTARRRRPRTAGVLAGLRPAGDGRRRSARRSTMSGDTRRRWRRREKDMSKRRPRAWQSFCQVLFAGERVRVRGLNERAPRSIGLLLGRSRSAVHPPRPAAPVGATGSASLALADLLGRRWLPAADTPIDPTNPLAVRPPHFAPRAKRVIFLFMHGGPSQVDTFDPKPLLKKRPRQAVPRRRSRASSSPRPATCSPRPWEFKPDGKSGIAGQRPVPARRASAPTTCASSARSTRTTRPTAGPCCKLHTGSDNFVRPRSGRGSPTAWGPRTRTCRASSPSARRWATAGCRTGSSAFLPAAFQGTPIGNAGIPAQGRADQQHRQPDSPGRPAADAARPARADQPRAPGPDRAGPGARGPDRLVRAGLPDAGRGPAARWTSAGESKATLAAVRHRRRPDRQLRPAVPAGPAVRGEGRAVHPVHPQLQVGPARAT